MKHSKLIAFFSLLLLLLQPVMVFAGPETLLVDQQEEFSLFKAKGSHALVLHEISIQTIEVSKSFPYSFNGEHAEIFSALSENKHQSAPGNQGLDKKHLLTSQIFPFHFHF